MTHTHVATGLQGYGPEGENGSTFEVANLEGIAESIRWELASAADFNDESAESMAEAGDFEEAWKAHKLAHSLMTTHANLNPERRNAPLYKDNYPLWYETLGRLIAEASGTDITYNARLYVWDCDEEECVTGQDD